MSEKEKNNAMSQEAFEKAQMRWAQGILDETARLTAKQRKSWDGKIRDIASADATEMTIKKEKAK